MGLYDQTKYGLGAKSGGEVTSCPLDSVIAGVSGASPA